MEPVARALGHHSRLRVVLGLWWTIGCGLDGSEVARDGPAVDAAAGTDPQDAVAGSPCAESRAGGFRVVDDEFGNAWFDGVVYARPPVPASEEVLVLRESVCTVYRLRPCGDCGCNELRCPEPRDVGTVTVTGLREPLRVEAPTLASAPRYGAVFDRSDDPSSEIGRPITLVTSGGDHEPIALDAVGVGRLVAPEQSLVVEAGKAVRVVWDEPASSAAVRIAIELRISELSWVECDVPDTGAFQISSSLTTALLARRPSLTNGLSLTRFSADSTAIAAGCVDFVVASKLSLPIQIPSLFSCLDGASCPDGMTCQGNFVCS